MLKLGATQGGSYEITLRKVPAARVVRHVTVVLPQTEQTVALRDGAGVVVCDAQSKFTDCLSSGQETIRIWLP
jgi:hypothetical protein